MPDNLPEERPQGPNPVFNEDNAYALAKMLGAWAVGLGPQYMAYQKSKGLLDAVGSAGDMYGVMTGEPYSSAKAFYGDIPVINYSQLADDVLARNPDRLPGQPAPVLSYPGTGLRDDVNNRFNVDFGENQLNGGLLRMMGK